MAFDQNSIPVDLRPLNIARTIAEDSRTAPMNTNGRSSEGFSGVGYGNAAPGVTRWLQGVPMAVMGTSGANSTLENRYNSPIFGSRAGGNSFEQASDEGGDDSNSGKKVKFLCSFGGKILPRPSDGALRYVGGQTRIISIRREASFGELVQKMVDTYGQNVIIKYQLPDEDLDALVSVSCPDDMENMMDEYQKLVERSSDGSAKLRVFLFSASELDASSVVQDFQDSGQRYVEAVNGIADGVGGVITRKESIASATSTQNSDLSGTEAVDSMLSPKENIATYQEIAPRFVCVDPNPTIYAEASGSPLVIPMVRSGPPPVLSIRPEQEIVRAPPVTIQQQHQQQQMCFDLQQPGATFPQPAPYLQAYVDPQQETLNRADYVQFRSQMGFPSQLSGAVGPMYTQQQFRDNAVGVSPHQFIPATHMTMNPSSHLSIRPNVGPPLVQPQQVRLEHYPSDQSYNAYQAQVPPPMVGGGYVWHQAHRPEQMAFSEGWVPNQQVIYPEKIPRYEDCYMCRKALPHAHSDTVAQGQTDRSTTNVSDLNSVCHSLQSVDSTRGPPLSRAAVTGAVEGVGVQQNIEGLHENDRTILQKADNPDHSKVTVPQDVVGLAGGLQSPYCVFTGTITQSCQENAVQQLVLPTQYQIKQDDLMNTPVYSDTSSVGGMASQTSDHLVQESSKDYSGKFPGINPREDALESCFIDHLRQIDGLMENLQIHPPEAFCRNESSKAPVDNPTMEDNLESRQQQVAGRDLYVDNLFGNPKMVVDANWARQNEMLPCSSSEAPQLSNFQPVVSYEVAQAQLPHLGDPSYPPHSQVAVNRLTPDEVSYCNPAFSCVDSAHVTESIPPLGEWKDNPSQFQPKMVPTVVEAVPSDDNFLSSVSPSYGVGDIQDSSNSLFSNQDPWKLQHGSHFPPPRPNKILMKKETFGTRNPFGDHFGNFGGLKPDMRLEDGVYRPYGNLEVDFGSEQTQSSKGSAEEQIKQELQAVAEGVAANVLQLSMHSNPDLTIHGMSESSSEAYRNNEVQGSDVKLQHGDRFEAINTELLEKTNLGFPVSEGIGRLQIIKNDDLEELRELGSGTFGTVYHGKWRGSDVAIKRINDRCFAGKPSEQDRMRRDFWNEAIKLADLHHPNVVAFYGVVLDGPGGTVATVTEYMVNGSLRTALQKNERNLDKRKRLIIAMDVAFGMEYLHGKNIVHFDLKSDNLLVNLRDPHRPICKVGDLGLSKVKCQTLISGGVRGTLPWMAPELLNGSSSLVSEKVDVFSFGIVLWELLTGDEPYADLHYGAIIGGIVSNTLRPPVPESCDPEWRSLMEKCWSAEPLERPNFTEIANQLRIMATKVIPNQQTTAPS